MASFKGGEEAGSFQVAGGDVGIEVFEELRKRIGIALGVTGGIRLRF